jgi:N-acetylmuramoyl-L-alanine amidase
MTGRIVLSLNICVFFCSCLLLFLASASPVAAQSELHRISAVERADGQGYVIRYHLSELIDSSLVVQPTADLIQMKLYSEGLDTLDLRFPAKSDTFTGFEVHITEDGLGIDIFLGPESYFKTNVYPDQNNTDLLLALEFTSEDDVRQRSEGVMPIAWITKDTLFDPPADDQVMEFQDDMNFNVIVLDAGHGGHDPGTMNRELGIMEKDVALAVTLKVGEYIEEYLPDVKVVYTREEDVFVPLSERGLTATRANGDLFVSIHVNSAPSTRANGTETFFLGLARSQSALEVMKRENSVVDLENGDASLQLSEEELLLYELTNAGNMAISERVASMVEDQFKNRAQRNSRGVKQAGLEALWHASTPAILIELGFLSNPDEARFLTSDYGQAIMASAIFRAIRDYKNQYERSRNNGNANISRSE